MKNIMYITLFLALIACDGLLEPSPKTVKITTAEPVVITMGLKKFEVKIKSIDDARCSPPNPDGLRIYGALPSYLGASLIISEANCKGEDCSKEIYLRNYECSGLNITKREDIFNEEFDPRYFYDAKALGLEVGLLKATPNFEYQLRKDGRPLASAKYTYPSVENYELTLVVQ